MKKIIVVAVAVTALVLVGIAAYRFLSPKVVVTNKSGFPIEEVALTLPASRVVFGAVEPGGSSTIYYSRQEQSGTLIYSVLVNDKSHNGSLPYAGSAEFGRVIRIVVDARGVVTVN